MGKISSFFCLLLFLVSCTSKSVKVEVKNPSSYNRLNDFVEIDLDSEQLSKLQPIGSKMLLVKDEDGNLMPSQVTYDGKLLFQPVLKSEEVKKFEITLGDSVIYSAKVKGRLYPERKDDFAWENDRVGFRFYGAALKEIQAPTSALDLFYKRTPEIILDEWYKNDISGKASYHVDHGEGCDPYAVGQSLGAGGAGLYVDGKLLRNENFDSSELLDAGPLRITFKLKYPDLKVNDTLTVQDERVISLDAGSQLSRIVLDYGAEPLEVATGIVKRANALDSVIVAGDNTYIIYEEPTDPKNGNVFIAMVYPDQFDSFKNDTLTLSNSEMLHSLALKKYNGEPIAYFTGFAWDKYGFPSVENFVEYVSNFSKSYHTPLEVTYK